MKLIKKEDCDITMSFYEIRLSLIGACNQSCVYCGPFTDGKYDKGYENLLLTQIRELAKNLSPIINKENLHIQLTGGEPTLRRDLLEIVSILRGEGIKDIGITTNGSLINPELCLSLIERGLSDFHIHIPSLNLESYMKTVRRDFDNERIKNILESAKAIKNSGTRVEFNTPVTNINLDTLFELFNFCFDNQINLKLIEELSYDNSQINIEDIKNIVTQWIKSKGVNITESKIENRYGIIYQFTDDFFFRIAPVSEEFQANLSGGDKKALLDGRYWVGSRNGNFFYTPSYFLDPVEGDIKNLKNQLENVALIYKDFFNKS